MSSRKAARRSLIVSTTDQQRSSASRSPFHQAFKDIAAVIVAGLAFLGTAYWLISHDFAYVYLSGAIYTAALAYFVSATWLRNTFVAVAAMSLSLMAAEFFLRAVEDDGSAPRRQNYARGYSEPLRSNGGPLGYAPFPRRTVEAWKTIGFDRVYDVTYTIDNHRLRTTPGIRDGGAGRSTFLFFGGSFAFGEGLNDDETLPYYFAQELAFDHPVVNLGFSGYGPHQMLRSLEDGMLGDVVSGLIRAAVYVALPDHVDRAAGKVWWDPFGPKYELDSQGIARYSGPFTRVPEPFIPIFYRILQVIEVARRSLVIDRATALVVNVRQDDPQLLVRTFIAIVDRAAHILKETYGADLYVLFWDDDSDLSEEILKSLAANNLETIKVSDVIPLEKREAYRIPNDGHPTAAANELLAKALSKRILAHRPVGVGENDKRSIISGH